MTSFQIALLSLALAGAGTGVALVSKNIIGRATGAVLLVLIALGAVFTVVPNWTSAIAHAIGVGRGTDLILYLLVIGSSTGFLVLYVKLRAVRREVTLLVRKIALDGSARSSSDTTHRKS